MCIAEDELDQVKASLLSIVRRASTERSLERIVVGGASGTMGAVAACLKAMLPGTRIEIRNHHKSRGERLKLRKKL